MNKREQHTKSPCRIRAAWLAVLVAGAALTLAACDKSDNRTAGEKLDSAVAKTEQAAETAAAKTGEAVKDAKAKFDASGTTAEMKAAWPT
jgi:hyperosmotically inducible protein